MKCKDWIIGLFKTLFICSLFFFRIAVVGGSIYVIDYWCPDAASISLLLIIIGGIFFVINGFIHDLYYFFELKGVDKSARKKG